jgi:hypothetical protein
MTKIVGVHWNGCLWLMKQKVQKCKKCNTSQCSTVSWSYNLFPRAPSYLDQNQHDLHTHPSSRCIPHSSHQTKHSRTMLFGVNIPGLFICAIFDGGKRMPPSWDLLWCMFLLHPLSVHPLSVLLI